MPIVGHVFEQFALARGFGNALVEFVERVSSPARPSNRALRAAQFFQQLGE